VWLVAVATMATACGSRTTATSTSSPTWQASPSPTSASSPSPSPTSPNAAPTPPPAPQFTCGTTPGGPPLALVWPTDPTQTLLIDLHDITRPRTLCALTNAYSLVRFYSATEISYAPLSAWASGVTTTKLVRTNVLDQVTRTFVSAETGTVEAWDWSPAGNTLAYFAGDHLWLKAGNQPAASIAAFTKQGGRGGGWDDEIAIRFSPTGTYFVLVHTVTIPNTFQVRRASDGGVVWASPSTDVQSPAFATMAVWSQGVDRLYFRDGTGVRTWDPSGTVTTLVPGLRWYEPSTSPDGRAIAYMVLDAQGNPRLELLDLQTLKTRALPSLRRGPHFASAVLLLYGGAYANGPPGAAPGVFAYNLTTGLETALPYDILLDVRPG